MTKETLTTVPKKVDKYRVTFECEVAGYDDGFLGFVGAATAAEQIMSYGGGKSMTVTRLSDGKTEAIDLGTLRIFFAPKEY